MIEKAVALNINEEDMGVLQALQHFFATLNKPVYLVGGYVRNCLLGLPPSDLDITSEVLPGELLLAAHAQGITAAVVNKRLGTVLLEIDGIKLEHTTFRKESYGRGGGHTPQEVTIGVSLEEDALRRDFTVNALYYNISEGRLLDPTGMGLEDIERGRLRAVTTDPKDMIADDGLRLLRMVRFACQLNFTIDGALFRASKKYVHQILDISKERIIAELDAILLSDTKYCLEQKLPAPRRGILYMGAMNLLETLIPEFDGYKEIGKCVYHKHTVFGHTAATVGHTPPDKVLRYAALFHDVGKPSVWKETGKMLGHDMIGAEIVKKRMPMLGADKKTTREVATLVREHMYDLNGNAREKKLRLKAQQMGYELFLKFADLRVADVYGSGKYSGKVETAERFREVVYKMQEQNTPMTTGALNIDGRQLMDALGVEGEAIGTILRALLHQCVIQPSQNEYTKLLKLSRGFFKTYKKQGGLPK